MQGSAQYVCGSAGTKAGNWVTTPLGIAPFVYSDLLKVTYLWPGAVSLRKTL